MNKDLGSRSTLYIAVSIVKVTPTDFKFHELSKTGKLSGKDRINNLEPKNEIYTLILELSRIKSPFCLHRQPLCNWQYDVALIFFIGVTKINRIWHREFVLFKLNTEDGFTWDADCLKKYIV